MNKKKVLCQAANKSVKKRYYRNTTIYYRNS